MRQRWAISLLLLNIVLRVLVTVIRQGKDTEGIQIRKTEVKLCLLSENVILHLKEPRDPRQFLGLTNILNKVTE